MTKENPIFGAMNAMVKYSDFVARMTHYQLEMVKAPKEEKEKNMKRKSYKTY
jgi:hypothetical protein